MNSKHFVISKRRKERTIIFQDLDVSEKADVQVIFFIIVNASATQDSCAPRFFFAVCLFIN